MTATPEDIIAVSHIVKDARKALEPVLKPLEGEIRGELGMGEMAKLSTMLLTYNLDKGLATEKAAKNYIAMQDIMLAAAARAVKLPNITAHLPAAVKETRVKDVLTELKANALLKVLGHGAAASFTPKPAADFDD